MALHAAFVSHWLLQVLTRQTSRSIKLSSAHCLSAMVVASSDALAGSALGLTAALAGALALALGAAAALGLAATPVPWLSSAAIKLTSLSAAGVPAALLFAEASAGLLAVALAGGTLAMAVLFSAPEGLAVASAGAGEASAFSIAALGGFTPSSSAAVSLPSLLAMVGLEGAGSLMIWAAASGARATALGAALLLTVELGCAVASGCVLAGASAFSSMMTDDFALGLVDCWVPRVYW